MASTHVVGARPRLMVRCHRPPTLASDAIPYRCLTESSPSSTIRGGPTKKIVFIVMFCVVTHLPAHKLYVYPATAVAPRGSYWTVTAAVDSVNNKTLTWTASSGSLVGTNPCVVNELCTIALCDTRAETDTLAAATNARRSNSCLS